MSRVSYLILKGFICFQLIMLGAIFGFNQAQDYDDRGAIQHEVTVTLKLVQIQVVDKQGQPVIDLGKSDFTLKDNGKTKEITDFEKHISPEQAKSPEPQVPTSSEGSFKLNRKFLFFFDFAFNTPTGVIKSKEAAMDFVATQISPEDEIGVVSYSARMGLKLHEFLTRDHIKVTKVITGLGGAQAMGRAIDLGDRYLADREALDEALSATGGGEFVNTSEITRKINEISYEASVLDFATRVKDLASILRSVPGQKNIILFSSGITNYVLYGKRLEGVAGYYVSLSDNWGNSALREAFSDMGKALASSNCIIYAINVVGQGPGRFDDRMLFQGSGQYDDKNLSGDLSLKQIASETGGRYFDNVKNYETINEEIQKSTGSYYVLGYYIDDKIDGKYHKVDVSVKRKGCRAIGQKGYFDPKPFSEYTANEKLLQLIDLALNDHPYFPDILNFPLMVLPYFLGDKSELALLAKLPMKKIEQATGQKVEIVTLVLNQKQEVKAFKRDEITGWPGPAEDAFVTSFVSLEPGEYQCRLILRNLETGIGARSSCRVSIPRSQSSRFMLLSPLVLEPGKKSVFINCRTEAANNPGKAHFVDIYPFDTELYCPLMEPLARTNTHISVVVRGQGLSLQNSDLVFSAQLIAIASGEMSPASVSVIKQSGNDLTFMSELQIGLGELKAGEYTLKIYAEERHSGQQSIAMTTFKVD